MSPTRHYFTMFDGGYLPRALVLLDSLRAHGGDFRLTALCLDAVAEAGVAALGEPRVEPLPLAELERDEPRLAEPKRTRSRAEYYFTLAGVAPSRLLARRSELDLLTYLDADSWLLSSPEPVFAELEGWSVGVVEHDFARLARRRLRFGRFNVGWISWRNDASGRACAGWWAERCLEWCYDRVEADRFADQKYLDRWPALFDGVRVLSHRGVNVGPWNVGGRRVTADGDRVLIDGEPLVHYHFQGVRRAGPRRYATGASAYLTRLSPIVRARVYAPYLRALLAREGGAVAAPARRPDAYATSLHRRTWQAGRAVAARLLGEYIELAPTPADAGLSEVVTCASRS